MFLFIDYHRLNFHIRECIPVRNTPRAAPAHVDPLAFDVSSKNTYFPINKKYFQNILVNQIYNSR